LITEVQRSDQTAGTSVGITQFLETVLDYDDSVLLTSENACLEYDNFRQSIGTRRAFRVLRPKISNTVYKLSGTTIGFQQPNRPQWLDCAYADIPHYGIKGVVPTNSSNTANIQMRWKIYVTLYFSMKEVR